MRQRLPFRRDEARPAEVVVLGVRDLEEIIKNAVAAGVRDAQRQHEHDEENDKHATVLTSAEAAELLKMSRRTLLKLSKPGGPLNAVKIGRLFRYNRLDLERFMAGGGRNAPQDAALDQGEGRND